MTRPISETEHAQLHESEARLAQAIDIGRLGHWKLDPQSFEFTTSPLCRANFGRDPNEPFSYEDLVASIHPDDRERQAEVVSAAIENRSSFEVQFRGVTPENELRWIEVRAHFETDSGRDRFVGVSLDITDRKRAEIVLRENEEALRESEQRQAFLLKLSDVLRSQPDAVAVGQTAVNMIAAHMELDRCYIATISSAGNRGWVGPEFLRSNLPSITGEHRYPEAPEVMQPMHDTSIVVADTAIEASFTEEEKGKFGGMEIGALLVAPLRHGENDIIWTLSAATVAPRVWTTAEQRLLEEVAERTWAALERVRAEQALRQSEARLAVELAATRRLQELSAELVREQNTGAFFERLLGAATEVMDADAASIQVFNPAAGRLNLVAWKGFHPESARVWERVTADSSTTCGVALSQGKRIIAADTHLADFMVGTQDLREYDRSSLRAVQSTPLVSRIGMPLGMMSTHWRLPHHPSERDLALFDVLARQAADLIERSRTEQKLRESEERLRHIIDSAKEYAIISLDRDGRIASWNDGAERLLGYSEEEAIGQSGSIFFTSEDRERGQKEHEMRLAREKGRGANERWHVRKDGSRFWASGVMLPMGNDRNAAYLKIFRDRTDERLAEERQKLLINELNHRVKNTLATVQAIASQTLRRAGIDENVKEDFELRLRGLAASHDVLTQETWKGASLVRIITSALKPFTVGKHRVRIDGPTLNLGPKPALALSMVLHELATNATKYGALSNETGRIEISWKMSGDDDPRLHLRWKEIGGPPVAPPTRKGFGSRLIERSVARDLGASVRMDYAADGVVCAIDAPAAKLGEGGQSWMMDFL